jgi:hypothetical protein
MEGLLLFAGLFLANCIGFHYGRLYERRKQLIDQAGQNIKER